MTEFETWLQSHRNLRPATAALYGKCLNRIHAILGRDPRIPDVDAVRDAIVRLSPSSRRNILQALEHWFDYNGVPIAIEHKPRARRRAPEYLTKEQVAALLGSDLTLEEHAILSVLYYGALRIQEAVALTWDAIDFGEGRIRVREGKGGRSDDVFVPAACVNSLMRVQQFQMSILLCEHSWIFHHVRFDDGRAIQDKECRRLSKSRAYEVVVRAGERAGIPLHPHMLRHSIATHLVNGGSPFPFVQKHLRHADPSSTLIYFHTNPETQRKAMERYMPRLGE
jgi:integrase